MLIVVLCLNMKRSEQSEDGLKKQLEEALKEVWGFFESKMGGKSFSKLCHIA